MLAPGDVINVQVFNEPELSVANLRIPGNGVISYPLLGRIDTQNHSVATLEKHITALLLNGYLKKPEVSISMASYRPFFVKGDVTQPGSHPFSEGMTLEQALTIAGGSSEFGENTTVSVNRFNGETVQAREADFPIRPGDVITVKRDVLTEAEEATNYIYLYGEVNKPGGYEFRSGLTVEKAVAMAGGFTPRASKRKIDISRYSEGEGPRTLDGVKLTENILPGDVVTVGESWF
ncbi:MAG TPA: polysaccharide biosynthesis/export family protein [Arenicellales bacterium]|nr:polysaccharide biosynthesis/export family protein [Arenicellales bacterium]